jgi:uncharacterized protein (DUF2147 family)
VSVAARIAACAALILASAATVSAQPATPAGRWRTIDDKTGDAKSIVRIVVEGDHLSGTVEEVFAPPAPSKHPLCEKCAGPQKNQPIVGMRVIWDFTKDGDRYAGGRLLDPESGKIYKGTIRMTDNGQRLQVRGYIGFSALGRTQTWRRSP